MVRIVPSGTSLRSVVHAALLVAIATPAARAQSISLLSPDHTVNVGESIVVPGTLTLGSFGASKVDIFMLADNTGSMGSTIGSVWIGADAILGTLASRYDVTFGVGRYLGDPSESRRQPVSTDEFGYRPLLTRTTETALAKSAIRMWFADGGGDPPEGAFDALRQVAVDNVWRNDAQRLVVWFGDAPSHTETTTRAATIDALSAAGVRVVAFNGEGAGAGIDGRYGEESADLPGQAEDIVATVGGTLLHHTTQLAGAAFSSAVIGQIGGATSIVDLDFGSDYAGDGVEIDLQCTDARGCSDVAGGETRNFDLILTGRRPGNYAFDVFARGLGVSAGQTITVLSVAATAPVPEPSVWALLATGGGMMVFATARGRRRRTERRRTVDAATR